MRTFKISAAFAALLMSSAGAFAADLPRKTAPVAPVAVPLFTWTGFYVGVNAGYGWGETRANGAAVLPGNWNVPFANTLPGTLSGNLKPDGFVGGVQAGYNFQINQFVLGIEADAMYHDQKASRAAVNTFFGAAAPATFTARTEIEWSISIRGRIGVAFDRFLVYGTGGVAFADVSYNSNLDFRLIDGPGSFHALGLSDTRTGYVVGGGLEYAFTNNIIGRVEYLYYDFGKIRGATRNPFFAATQATAQEAKFTNNVVRAAVSFKF
jgi:outer membrane immunogenic protein